ncbi:MAG TPA: DeoR family transcriptional regulator [Dehalococcoidia bacterium]|nr:DeoR family transcriptional regulator [Dehalococcoidia bacterium]
MQTTKQQILVLLKRAGSVTIDEAAGALAIASMTARQHLTGLERDGLVQAEKVRRSTGRPHYLYSLTPKGDEMFPRHYELFAQLLLDEAGLLTSADIEGLDADQKRSLLLKRTADRLAARYQFPVEGRGLEERVSAVTDVLHLVGGFAEWLRIDGGFEIRDYNCVFARLTTEVSGCEQHTGLMTQLIKWPVQHELLLNGHVACCRYLVYSDARAAEGLIANA